MKKILLTFLTLFFAGNCVFADDKSDVLAVFDKYIQDANAYSTNLPNYYTKDAKIIRVVNVKSGGKRAVIIPFDRYLKELGNNAKFAKAVRYKNNYVNKKVTKENKDYKVSATRIPRNDKTGLPCYFIFTSTPKGWKIKEESMTTNVQAFLNAK